MRVTVDDYVKIKSEALRVHRSERAVAVSEIGLRLKMTGDRESMAMLHAEGSEVEDRAGVLPLDHDTR